MIMNKRPRNYSFNHRDLESLDYVENNGVIYYIPAAIGSTYWAIIKTMFENYNKPVYIDDLLNSVSTLMADRNQLKWDNYCNKTQTNVYFKKTNQTIVKNAKSWQDRIITNAKLLGRLGGESCYGLRLAEKGYQLVFNYNGNKPYFIIKPIEKKTETIEVDISNVN